MMFDPSRTSRLFCTAPGVDFPRAVVEGLKVRLRDHPPEALARVDLFVNTTRMARRIKSLFVEAGPGLLPRIRLVTDIARDPNFADIPPPVNPLARRLELAQLTRLLIEREPDLAVRDSAFDLADSLAALMDEMQGEGVDPAQIAKLDVGQHAEHWQRAQKFIAIVAPYFAANAAPDIEARQRRVVSRLAESWEQQPPLNPVIIAGSTGSRGTTRMLMKAVSSLPQGAVILPGFDTDMPQMIWDELGEETEDGLTHEDHPQYRFQRLMSELNLTPEQVLPWSGLQPANPARNALISMALRPAPVTDSWLGADLDDLSGATRDLTLLEAPSPRAEALAIALRLRAAVEHGEAAALITPDRVLSRAVTAALDRWRIEPDDSAGTPLAQSPPGRLLRQLAEFMHRPVTAERVLALLKNPLVHGEGRNDHLLRSRNLELKRLRYDMPIPTRDAVVDWAEEQDEATGIWAHWLFDLLDALHSDNPAPLDRHLSRLLDALDTATAGSMPVGPERFWDRASADRGRAARDEAKRVLDDLANAAPSRVS